MATGNSLTVTLTLVTSFVDQTLCKLCANPNINPTIRPVTVDAPRLWLLWLEPDPHARF